MAILGQPPSLFGNWCYNVQRLKGRGKDPGPEDPALVHPWKRVHCGLADLSLRLEYWSVGVLENRRQDKHPLGMETEINGVLSACALRDLDHHSNTPLLSPSRRPYEPEANTP
jgi:hypothetical protein